MKMDGKRITTALTSLVVTSIVGALTDDLSHFSYPDLHEDTR